MSYTIQDLNEIAETLAELSESELDYLLEKKHKWISISTGKPLPGQAKKKKDGLSKGQRKSYRKLGFVPMA